MTILENVTEFHIGSNSPENWLTPLDKTISSLHWTFCHKMDLIWNELTVFCLIYCCHFWMCILKSSAVTWIGSISKSLMFFTEMHYELILFEKIGGKSVLISQYICAVQMISHLIWPASTWLSPPQYIAECSGVQLISLSSTFSVKLWCLSNKTHHVLLPN